MRYVYGRKFGPRTIIRRYDRFGRWVKLLLDPTREMKEKPDRYYQRFLTRYGAKIISRHISGISAKQQRVVSKYLKTARQRRVIPHFVNRTVGWYFIWRLRQYKAGALRRARKLVNFVKKWRARRYRMIADLKRGRVRYKADVVGRGYRAAAPKRPVGIRRSNGSRRVRH
jgi:ribosomal protein S18